MQRKPRENTVLLRLESGLFFHTYALDLIGRTLIGHSATWAPTGRAFWTLDTKPTLPERDEVYVDATNGQLWDWGHLEKLMVEAASKPNSLIVDVGANIGTSAVWAGAHGASVLAVEAYPPTFALLCQNIAANSLEGSVFPLSWVAAEKDGRYGVRKEPEALEYDSEIMLGGVEFYPTEGEGAPGGPLDSIVPMYALGKRVTLIKVDAQGMDLLVLRGLRRTILEHLPVLCFEFEEPLATERGETWDDYESYVLGLGYDIAEVGMNNFACRPRQ